MTYHPRSIHPAASSAPQPALPERRRFTARELLAMSDAGILGRDERVELIDGEIISMPAKSARDDDASDLIDDLVSKRLPTGTRCVQEATLRLSDTSHPEPDLFVFPRSLRVSEVRGDTVLLVVEVAVSSLSLDLDVMAPSMRATASASTGWSTRGAW